jgi:outer membrane protein TolC
MDTKRRRALTKILLGLVVANGCSLNRAKHDFRPCGDPCSVSTAPSFCGPNQIKLASARICNPCGTGVGEPISPYDINESTFSPENSVPITLEECVQQALATSKVMRDLGGTIVRSPQSTGSVMDPAMIFSDPRIGEEAALSAFDANLFANSFFEENNRRSNNSFLGQQGQFEQYLSTSQVGVNKRSAAGGLFTLKNVTIGDQNNQASNSLGNQSWDSFFEAEARQPLLQGFGTEFNRIAGPGSTPGQLNGVLLARTRTDQSLIEFERSVRDLVAEVENAYWDLYYAYRDLEAKVQIRDIAESTLQSIKNRDEQASNVFQAEEQLHRFQADVVDAYNGRATDGTRTYNGSSGGTFRGVGGVRVAERKLRQIIGSQINDGMLLQPVDTPPQAPIIFDWNSVIADALTNREELKKQRWVIKQRELELIASRNFLKPQMDLVSRYRYRGFGDRLLADRSATGQSFFDGELQEWQIGLDYTMPVGFRRASAAVANSQLALVRETEILREQERAVHVGLSNAMGDVKRSYETVSLQRSRLDAIVNQLNALENKKKADEKPELDVILETHRRLLDARLRYHQANVEYALSLRNVHYEKGTLLAFNNVHLTESVSPPKSYIDATERIKYQDGSVNPASRDLILTQ